MFIQTEATPNPATLKFLPGRAVLDEGTFEALDAEQAERSPLAKALMEHADEMLASPPSIESIDVLGMKNRLP